MGLFENLQAKKEATETPAETPAPAAETPAQPEQQSLMDQLRAIGDGKGVNPPATETPATQPEPQPKTESNPAPAPTPQANSEVPPRESLAGAGFVLLLDAIYEKNDTKANGVYHLNQLIAPIAEAVAKENKVGHWALVEFNKGGAYLADRLDRFLAEHAPKGGVIIVDGSTPEGRVCKEVLRKHATVIIQGVR